MIYLDSAATSLQKPGTVGPEMLRAMKTMASPGRGGHKPAELAASMAYECRCAAAELFGMSEPERVVFTMNATHGLNIAIASLASAGDRVVVSGYEHNAVTRPLHMLGAQIDVAASALFEPEEAVREFEARLPGAKAAVCTHVSNVFGFILPIERISGLCREYGVPLIIDASQSAGILDVNFDALGAEFIAMPGHKGLLGPQGTGLLLCGDRSRPLMAGGTGSDSRSRDMPEYLPDRLEAGTHNITGIAGLLAGIRYVSRKGTETISAHEKRLTRKMAEALSAIPGLEIFVSETPETQSGVLSVRHAAAGSEEIAAALGERSVAVRAGLHCAPTAHMTAGTLDTGTVRFSFSPFNTEAEVERAAGITASVLEKLIH